MKKQFVVCGFLALFCLSAANPTINSQFAMTKCSKAPEQEEVETDQDQMDDQDKGSDQGNTDDQASGAKCATPPTMVPAAKVVPAKVGAAKKSMGKEEAYTAPKK